MIDYKRTDLYQEYLLALDYYRSRGYYLDFRYNHFENPTPKTYYDILYIIRMPNDIKFFLYFVIKDQTQYISMEIEPEYVKTVDLSSFYKVTPRTKFPHLKMRFREFNIVKGCISQLCDNMEGKTKEKSEYWPSLEEYDPGLSTDDWLRLLNDDSVFDDNSLFVIAAFYDIGGEATCKQLELKYGKDAHFYSIISSKLGKRIIEKTGCPELPVVENGSRWPVLFVGRKAVNETPGTYSWKLRTELKEALKEFGIEKHLTRGKKEGKNNISELRQYVTLDKFERAYRDFMMQAEKNAVSGKSEGSKVPYVFLDQKKGLEIHNHYGQGAASKTPYLNWGVVSIYYIVESERIVIGIEEDRYPRLKDLSGILRYDVIGKKTVRIAVFYETTKNIVDFKELWEFFMSVSEDVIKNESSYTTEVKTELSSLTKKTTEINNSIKERIEPKRSIIRSMKSYNSIIELREINKLIKENFYIPTYQRGYRWDEQQVTELLEDIHEFIKNGKIQDGEFYCLQPIVVKKREDGRYDVIDGQQRLTTFFIIQKYLQKRTFNIEYASREGSHEFLENISDYAENKKEFTNNNIDFFFMKKAYETIKDWFEDTIEYNEDYTLPDEFSTYLGKYCKVIWYEVDNDADSESIFTRLNIGKIPLTNAELVKALFLRKSNFEKLGDATYLRQLEIASEWDNMENTLQDDKVWYFINPDYVEAPPTRIEYIFDIIADKGSNDYSNYTFIEFSKMLESGEENIESLWTIIKSHFRIIMEWYENQRLFHLMGFLTSSKSGVKISELIKEYFSNNYKKDEFEEYVIQLIKDFFYGTDIEELSYEGSKFERDRIKDILLLFNIVTVMKKSSAYSRFPFDSYNKNKDAWSLEHIHAQNTDGMGGKKELWVAWIVEHLKSFKQFTGEIYKEVVEKLENVDRDNLDKASFDELFNDICQMIQNDYGMDLHSIDNLALLDIRDNSSISNNFFDVKRSMIIEKDRKGEFIPVCTRNVFLKYYSKDPSQIHYWSESDRKDYLERIIETIAPYFYEEEETND